MRIAHTNDPAADASARRTPPSGGRAFQGGSNQMKRVRLNTQPLTTPPKRDQSFQTAFDRAAVGLALVSPEGRWLRCNQHLCDLLGYSREELAARTWQDLTFPDDRDASDTSPRPLLPGERDAYTPHHRSTPKDGAPVWVHPPPPLYRT